MNRRRFLKASAAALSVPFIARGATKPSFEMGIVADAQYADIESTKARFYRQSIARLGEAVEHFNPRDLAFCVHLGDLIDRQWKSFDAISAVLARSRQSWHHLLGNHDFEVLDAEKAKVPGRLAMKARYSSFEREGFRFLVLDTNDVSTYAHAANTPEKIAATEELARVTAAKLRQAKPWNGAIGAKQIAWFERECANAARAKQRVIVFAHHPVFPDGEHTIWNAADMLTVLDRHPHVVAWINGHNHAGNYGEHNGLPCLTVHGMVETPVKNAFATAGVFADRIVIDGHGRVPSREMKFRG
jgi:manganese-dependent ADP-ribose/CDP-alcohol diphosphatase